MAQKPAADRDLQLEKYFYDTRGVRDARPFFCCRLMHEQDWPIDIADESLGAAPEN